MFFGVRVLSLGGVRVRAKGVWGFGPRLASFRAADRAAPL